MTNPTSPYFYLPRDGYPAPALLPRDRARIATLHPRLQPLAETLILRCGTLLHTHQTALRTHRISISQAYRSPVEQAALFGQGRTAAQLRAAGVDERYAQPSLRRVTNAAPGRSLHEFQLNGKPASRAFDIALIDKNGVAIWDVGIPEWELFGRVGEGLGLTWGGRFKSMPDRPHFEIHGV